MSSLMLGRGSNYCNENWCENPISNLKIDKTELLDVSVTELYTKFNFYLTSQYTLSLYTM